MFKRTNIAFILFSCLIAFTLFSCLRSLPKELEGYVVNYPLNAKWSDDTLKQNTYSNKGFGFAFTIPQDWYVSKQKNEEDSLEVNDSTNGNNKKDIYDLLSIEKVADTSIGRIITISFKAEPIFKYKDQWVKGAQAFLFNSKDVQEKQNEEPGYPMYSDLSYAEMDSISGKKFYYYDFKVLLDSTDNHYFQRNYASLFDSIILSIQFCYLNPSEKKEIISILNKTRWNKK